MTLVITTTRRSDERSHGVAEAVADRFGLAFLPYPRGADEPERVELGPEGTRLVTPTGRLRFHPGLAIVRIKRILAGENDYMCEVMGLVPRDTVLDCTLGLAADAVVAAYCIGPDGRVVGCEASLPVAVTVAAGLADYRNEHGIVGWGGTKQGLTDAMRRINVRHADHRSLLETTADASHTVVYFDPMFRVPVHAADGIAGLREFADPRPLNAETIAEARRVARRRVIVKERAGSPEFARLGLSELRRGSRRITYGWAAGSEE